MIVKLRNRLLRIIMAFVAVIVLLAFLAIFTIAAIRIRAENMEKITSEEIVEISSDGQVVLNGRELSEALVINRISPALGVYFNLLTDPNGELVYIDSALDLERSVYVAASEIARNDPDGGVVELAGRRWQYISSPAIAFVSDVDAGAQAADTLHRFVDVTDSMNVLRSLALTLSCLYVLLMLVFFFVARFFANRSVMPMAEAWESQRRFIADASHELKTPISTLNANLDLLYASADEPIRSQIKWLDNSKKVLNRMTSLIRDMLELARMDEHGEEIVMQEVVLGDIVEDVLDCFEPMADAKQVAILVDIDPALRAWTNDMLFQQIVEILMNNAMQYTENGGRIVMDLHGEKGEWTLRVQNTGPGIPAAEIDRVFDRFYRGDKARVHDGGNYGLGLSIAQSAAQKLGGNLRAKSNAEATVFTLCVPNQKPFVRRRKKPKPRL